MAMATRENCTFLAQSFSTEIPIPIPHTIKSASDPTISIKTIQTDSTSTKEVHFKQVALFVEHAWAYMKCDRAHRGGIADGLYLNEAKDVDSSVRVFFNRIFQLMASDNVGAADLCLHVVNGLTVSGRSVTFQKRPVTISPDRLVIYEDPEGWLLYVKRLSAKCCLSSRHTSLLCKDVIDQKTYIISADNESQDTTKKHEVALITFIGGVPFEPDDDCKNARNVTVSYSRPKAETFWPQETMVRSSDRVRSSVRSTRSTSMQLEPPEAPPAYTP